MSLEIYGDGTIKVGGVTAVKFNANPIVENETSITADHTIPAGKNAFSAGPITISDGITVTVGEGSEWTVV
jgi:hypothetical protein